MVRCTTATAVAAAAAEIAASEDAAAVVAAAAAADGDRPAISLWHTPFAADANANAVEGICLLAN